MKNIIRLSLIALITSTLAPFCHAQAQLAGDWQGTLDVNGGQLHIVLHIVAAKDGSLSITADNPDQGQMGVAADAVTFKNSNLTITMNTYNGTYEGTVNNDASAITGTWTADDVQELNFKRVAAAPAPVKTEAPATIDGTWLGALDTGAIKLRVVFKIATAAEGLSAQLQS